MMWVAYRRDEEAVRRLLADPDEIEELLASDGPACLVFATDPPEQVWPTVPPGAANHEMLRPAPAAIIAA